MKLTHEEMIEKIKTVMDKINNRRKDEDLIAIGTALGGEINIDWFLENYKNNKCARTRDQLLQAIDISMMEKFVDDLLVAQSHSNKENRKHGSNYFFPEDDKPLEESVLSNETINDYTDYIKDVGEKEKDCCKSVKDVPPTKNNTVWEMYFEKDGKRIDVGLVYDIHDVKERMRMDKKAVELGYDVDTCGFMNIKSLKYPKVLYKDDNHFIGTRQSGKTTWLIDKFIETNKKIWIVVPNRDIRKDMIDRYCKKVKATKVERFIANIQIITYEEYQTEENQKWFNKFNDSHKYIYIDELNLFMKNYTIDLKNIAGYTLTIDDREK